MAKEKKTRYVILGFLAERPLSGYELGEMIKASTAYFWQESDASIYPTLKKLAQEGKVTFKRASVGQRKKEIFTITKAGKKEFEEWYVRPAEPDIRREEFLLKLFFTKPATEHEMAKHYERRLRKLHELLEVYRDIEKALLKEHPDRKFVLQTLQHGIAHTELEISWIKSQRNRNS